MNLLRLAFVVLLAVSAVAQPAPDFPRGTTQFFDTDVSDAVADSSGGVWAAGPGGVTRYAEAGTGATLPTAGGRPFELALAGDGSIWLTTASSIVRMSTTGTVLEQYAVASIASRLTVASDGTLWYLRTSGSVIGRIAGGTLTELPSPVQAWSLAAASNGDVWILPSGFGSSLDSLHRMTAAGGVTELPLGQDVLFGTLQALPDGTLYIGTGIRTSVLRLDPGEQTVDVIDLPGSEYLSDAAGNLWIGGYETIGFISRDNVRRVFIDVPGDPRECMNTPVYMYRPLAIDSTGGVWLRTFDDAAYLPGSFPCNAPEPPAVPDLLRIDGTTLLSSHLPGHAIPALSPLMLVALAAALAAVALWQFRV